MPRKLQDLPPQAKKITSTLAMKKKVKGKYRAILNVIGHE